MELFARRRAILPNGEELFGLTSWVQVMLGQRIYPRTYHPAVDWVADKDMLALVDHVEKVVDVERAADAAARGFHSTLLRRNQRPVRSWRKP